MSAESYLSDDFLRFMIEPSGCFILIPLSCEDRLPMNKALYSLRSLVCSSFSESVRPSALDFLLNSFMRLTNCSNSIINPSTSAPQRVLHIIHYMPDNNDVPPDDRLVCRNVPLGGISVPEKTSLC